MSRDALTELGESLRNDFQSWLGTSEDDLVFAELDREAQRLWETLNRQFEVLLAGLTSVTVALDLSGENDTLLAATDDSARDRGGFVAQRDPSTRASSSVSPREVVTQTDPDPKISPPGASGVRSSADFVPPQAARPGAPLDPFERSSLASRVMDTPVFRAAPPDLLAAIPEQSAFQASRVDSSAIPPAPPPVPPLTSPSSVGDLAQQAVKPTRRTPARFSIQGEKTEWPPVDMTNGSLDKADNLSTVPAEQVFKPVRSLQDLAQALSTGPSLEEAAPPAVPKVTAPPIARRRAASSETARTQKFVEPGQEDTPARSSDFRQDEEDRTEITSSFTDQAENAAPEPDMESILEALARNIAEDYKRFYRS